MLNYIISHVKLDYGLIKSENDNYKQDWLINTYNELQLEFDIKLEKLIRRNYDENHYNSIIHEINDCYKFIREIYHIPSSKSILNRKRISRDGYTIYKLVDHTVKPPINIFNETNRLYLDRQREDPTSRYNQLSNEIDTLLKYNTNLSLREYRNELEKHRLKGLRKATTEKYPPEVVTAQDIDLMIGGKRKSKRKMSRRNGKRFIKKRITLKNKKRSRKKY